MITRRDALMGVAATGAVLASRPSWAELALGNGKLSTVYDGSLTLPGSFLFDGLPADKLQPILSEFGLSTEQVEPDCNLALYQDGTHNVLFDVGSGPDFMPNAGQIVDSLDSAGLAPEDITHVVFTHAHPDHIWGLLDDFDEPLFLEAEYIMGRKEWDYWWDPETVNSIGDARAAFAVGAKRRMEVIADQVRLINPDENVLPGIQSIAAYGHTPGHMAFDIEGRALVVGDAIGNHHIALRHPDWAVNSDQDPQAGIVARQMLLDRLVNEKLAVVGFHLPQGGLGRLDRNGDSLIFIPESDA